MKKIHIKRISFEGYLVLLVLIVSLMNVFFSLAVKTQCNDLTIYIQNMNDKIGILEVENLALTTRVSSLSSRESINDFANKEGLVLNSGNVYNVFSEE